MIGKISCGLSVLQLPQLELDLYKVSHKQALTRFKKHKSKQRKKTHRENCSAVLNMHMCMQGNRVSQVIPLSRILVGMESFPCLKMRYFLSHFLSISKVCVFLKMRYTSDVLNRLKGVSIMTSRPLENNSSLMT